jgi:Flp pilus assembly protein TadD
LQPRRGTQGSITRRPRAGEAKETGGSNRRAARAAELEPDRARYAYVYAIGLDSTGRRADAIQALKDNLARHPADRDTLSALISFNRDAGDFASALAYAEQLVPVEQRRTQEPDRDATARAACAWPEIPSEFDRASLPPLHLRRFSATFSMRLAKMKRVQI